MTAIDDVSRQRESMGKASGFLQSSIAVDDDVGSGISEPKGVVFGSWIPDVTQERGGKKERQVTKVSISFHSPSSMANCHPWVGWVFEREREMVFTYVNLFHFENKNMGSSLTQVLDPGFAFGEVEWRLGFLHDYHKSLYRQNQGLLYLNIS